MGEVQIDLLLRLIRDRFGIECSLDAGRILYKEKINRMRSYDELCGIVEEFRKELNDYYLNKDKII